MAGRTGKPGKRTHRRDRVARRFLAVVGVLALLVLAAPTLVGSTPLRGWLLAKAVPPEAGVLSVESASLGWFTQTSLTGVHLVDDQGRVVLHADRVHLDRSLWQLMGAPSDLGTITIDRPAVLVVARPDGSSLEDLLAKLDQPDEDEPPQPDDAAKPPTRATVVVRGGSLAVVDSVTNETVVHDPLNATLTIDDGLRALQAAGTAHAAVLPPGTPLPTLPLTGQGTGRGAAFAVAMAPTESGLIEASIESAGVNLASGAPWLRRWDPTIEISGVVEGRGVVRWPATSGPAANQATGPSPAVTSDGSLRATGLRYNSRHVNEPIAVDRVDLPWRVRTDSAGGVTIEQFNLQTGFAKANLRGAVTAEEIAQFAEGDWLAPGSITLEGDIDLAGLARVAPALLHLRQGVVVRSGRVKLQGGIQRIANGRSINAELSSSSFAAKRNGQSFRWEDPLRVELDATQSAGRLRVNKLTCDSAFLTGEASGDAGGFRAEADLNLDRLVAETRQLIDYGNWRLSGRARANANLTRIGANAFSGRAEASIDGCIVTHGDREIVVERKLALTAQGDGGLDPQTLRPARLDQAKLEVESGSDALELTLLEPAAADATDWPLEVQLRGDVAAWLRRLQSVIANDALADVSAGGAIQAKLRGRFAADRVNVASADINATNLTVDSEALRINEPRFGFQGDIAWDSQQGAVRSRSGLLRSNTLAAEASNLLWQANHAGGELAVRVNLNRLSTALPGLFEDTRLAGEVTGGVRLRGVGSAEVDLLAKPLRVISAGGEQATLLDEPQATARGSIAYNSPTGKVTLTNLAVGSPSLSGVVSGDVASGATRLRGAVDYDLARLTPLAASYLGPGVQLVGKHQAEFEVATVAGAPTGAHWSRTVVGKLSAPWTSASLYGLPIGAGTLVATLGEGQLRTEPIAFSVGQGSASFSPVVVLDPPPMVWGLPAGPVIENVRISREVSERMLKYVAPMLADATRAEGTFSLRTDGVRAPIGHPEKLASTGQLTIRNLQVTPGPGASEWVSMGRAVEALAKGLDPSALASRPTPTLLSISERTINYQVAEGRVYHQGLEFLVDGVPVSSTGSVGFDESLQLTLSVPIQDRWIADRERLVGLRGQVVRVPVTGSLDRPRIDRRELERLSRDLVRSGLRGAVEQELGRAIQKLFD